MEPRLRELRETAEALAANVGNEAHRRAFCAALYAYYHFGLGNTVLNLRRRRIPQVWLEFAIEESLFRVFSRAINLCESGRFLSAWKDDRGFQKYLARLYDWHVRSRLRVIIARHQELAAAARNTRRVETAMPGVELDEMVSGALTALPQRERQLFYLHYLEGRTVASIASSLGVSKNSVEVRLHRLRERLRKRLHERED